MLTCRQRQEGFEDWRELLPRKNLFFVEGGSWNVEQGTKFTKIGTGRGCLYEVEGTPGKGSAPLS